MYRMSNPIQWLDRLGSWEHGGCLPPHSNQVAGLKWVQALPSLCPSALNHSAILELVWGYKVQNSSCSLFRHESLVAAGFGAASAHSWVFAWLGARSVTCLLFSQWVIWLEETYFGQAFPQWLCSLGRSSLFSPWGLCLSAGSGFFLLFWSFPPQISLLFIPWHFFAL